MKKGLKIKAILAIAVVVVGATSAQAWNPGTHVLIIEQVFPLCLDKFDLYYGSIAPDLALYVPENLEANWPLENSFYDTHYEFIDLRKDAWGFLQQTFANGWLKPILFT